MSEPDRSQRVSRRDRLVLALFVVPAVMVAGLALALAAVASRESDVEPAIAEGPRSNFSGSLLPRGVPAPRFALRDEDGRPLRSEDLRGRPAIVTFLYTRCKDTCPIEAQQIRGALDLLSDTDQEVPAIAVAVDPPRDTATSARRFLTEQRVYGRIRFALGSRKELEPVWRGFFIQEQKPDAEHQARVTLIDSRGFQRVGYPVNQLTPDGVAKDVRILLAEDAGRRN